MWLFVSHAILSFFKVKNRIDDYLLSRCSYFIILFYYFSIMMLLNDLHFKIKNKIIEILLDLKYLYSLVMVICIK